MKPPPFSYHDPRNVEEAVGLVNRLENAKLLAGVIDDADFADPNPFVDPCPIITPGTSIEWNNDLLARQRFSNTTTQAAGSAARCMARRFLRLSS